MRIIKSLFTFFVMVCLLTVVVVLSAREIFLVVGINQVSSSLKRLRQIESKGQYVNECLSRGSIHVEGEEIVTLQLRFVSDNEYVIEALCNQFRLDPILVEEIKLYSMVKKMPGESGIIWGDDLSGVHLSMLGRQGVVYVEDREIQSSYREILGLDFESEPVSGCGGYGFSCCQIGFEQGLGDQLVGATDCPKACFASCRERPVVLSLNSQPFFDAKTRQVSISSGQTITFSYVVSDTQVDSFEVSDVEKSDAFTYGVLSLAEKILDKKDVEQPEEESVVIVDFGDGNQEVVSELQGEVNHAYTCAQDSCRYKVVVRSRNHLGVESVDNLINTVMVLVSR